MINFKQEELIENLLDDIRSEFPEVRLIKVHEGPEDPETLWIRVTSPDDEDRESALIRYSSEKSMDILETYGYHMLIMPTKPAHA